MIKPYETSKEWHGGEVRLSLEMHNGRCVGFAIDHIFTKGGPMRGGGCFPIGYYEGQHTFIEAEKDAFAHAIARKARLFVEKMVSPD